MNAASPTQPTAVDILRAGRELIAEPACWTHNWYWRDGHGEWVDRQAASCFCSAGALAYASGETDPQSFEDAPICKFFETANDIPSIVTWNDDIRRTHAEVMAAFDRAITLAQQSSS